MMIGDAIEDDEEVDFIALVEYPAIQKNFLAFKNQEFVEPTKGESKEDFLPRCIEYIINEGKENEQAVAICNSLWESHFAGVKISFDFDDTISTQRGQELAAEKIDAGEIVYIISARNSKENIMPIANELGIPSSRVFAVGSNKAKIEKIKELGIQKHYDNNPEVISELGSLGEKFSKFKDDFHAVGFNQFNIQNPEQRIVTGALMIADLPIYRRDGEEEYYVTFSAAEIKKIVQRFFKKGYQSRVNVEHSTPVDGVFMFESYIIDREKGIMPPNGFEEVSDGSWFGSFKVENEKIWEEVKAGTFKGFSVEGLFRYEKTNQVITEEEQIMNQIFKILSQIEQ